MKKLLVADLSKRFGNLKDGAADILQNKWFSTYELPKLEAMEAVKRLDFHQFWKWNALYRSFLGGEP